MSMSEIGSVPGQLKERVGAGNVTRGAPQAGNSTSRPQEPARSGKSQVEPGSLQADKQAE